MIRLPSVLIRRTTRVAAVLAFVAAPLQPAWAGEQRYEPLAAALQTALSSAVRGSSRQVPEPVFDSVMHKIDWLASMSSRLPRKWAPDADQRISFLKMARYEAQRAGLDPQLVLALIQVESNFRRYAVSRAGARGYMQVMPFWTELIGDGDAARLFDMRTNLRYGCTILRHYLDREHGNLVRALGRYNGSLGSPVYPDKVFAALERWRYRPSAALTTASR
ncbi:MAG: lytic transglycosylase domain-containing protein [Burkholderiaceae bacterium]